MPSITIHEKVGYKIGEKIAVGTYDYYLGLLAPDTPNLYGFAPKEERWTAHIRRHSLNEWRISLKEFYEKNLSNYPKDFLLGYYIHILTDIVFDDFFYKSIRKDVMKNNYSKEEAHSVMSKDMQGYDFVEFKEIKEILRREEKSYSINNISKELLSLWKEKNIDISRKENEREYVTEKVIEELIELVYKELVENNIFTEYF